MAASDPQDRPLSEVVRELARSQAATMSLGEVVDAFGASALAGLLLVFGLACALPFLPPGATTVFGMPLVLLAPQLLFDQPSPWLPKALRARRIAMPQLRRVLQQMTPLLRRMEKISRPRLSFAVGTSGRRVMGLICTACALVLILPIPLGNMLPAATVTVFSLALIQRDGAVALAGYVFAAASVGALVLAANLIGVLLRTGLQALALA